MSADHHHGGDCCGSGNTERINRALSQLRERGLRTTDARRSMLRTLAQAKVPLSADDIHRRIGSTKADRVTVYRSLEAFEQAGIVQRHPLEKGRALYALTAAGHHHHHLVCRGCGAIERLGQCDAAAIESAAASRGYTSLSHVLEIHGLCPKCSHG